MLFNSYEFLFLFFPIVLLGYYLVVPKKGRLVFLTVASYFFYGWWDYRFCTLMLISTLIDYAAGRRIHVSEIPGVKKRWLMVSIVTNLSLLGFFKYFDLAARTVNRVALLAGASSPLLPILDIILPVGISFYTFQSMSYSIDIYLGAATPARGFWGFACYVALFPQLIAGPIVRYRDLAQQLVHRDHTLAKMATGATFFILGLGKKVILADGVGALVGNLYDLPVPGMLEAWFGVVSYTLQIYFDFSGYSDMAVGLGLMFGFVFRQNFNSPYKAISITDYWQRWHISLSSWLRDYLYISFLGGNRFRPWRSYVNLFLTMLLGGLWHGASWTFVLWGGYHGVLLALERMVGKRSLFWWTPRLVQQLTAFLFVVFGFVVFRSSSLSQMRTMFAGMLGLHGWGTALFDHWHSAPVPFIMMGVSLFFVFCLPNTWEIRWRASIGLALGLTGLLVACILVILVNTSSPFLYFQF